MIPAITKDTTLCISLSGRPSNLGTRFHNFLYDELGLDFVYKSFTTNDVGAAVGGVRALGIRGCAVSMPFKEAVIPLVDEMDPSAAVIESVNTIVNTDRRLRAYNTDYSAVASLLADVPTDDPFLVLGSGGMAKAVVAALRDGGFGSGTVIARNEATGRALAERYGYAWQATPTQPAKTVVNATPVGMAGGPAAADLPLSAELLVQAATVFEVVAVPEDTPMVRLARQYGQRLITGTQVLALQAADQFALYTGVRPTPDQVARASAYSREG